MYNEITILTWLFHVEVMKQMGWKVLLPDSILVQNKPQDSGERESWNS